MKSKYAKNYTERGYLMKYEKPRAYPFYKNIVFQFKIELFDIEPLIWRRILVPSDYNFWDLHVAIQDSMGWLDYHLHHFEIRKKHKREESRLGIPDFEGMADMPEVFPGWEVPVHLYFEELGMEARYNYDYGDDWWHTVKLEGYIYREKGIKYPVCIGGERACPPEDCGGAYGYYNVLDTLSDPDHDDHEAMRTWVGEGWDPEKFNKDEVEFDNPYKRWKGAFLKK